MNNMSEQITVTYHCDGKYYEISGPINLHKQIESDREFAVKYFNDLVSQQENIENCISTNDNNNNDDNNYNDNNNNDNNNTSFQIPDTDEIDMCGNITNNTDEIDNSKDNGSLWNECSTKLLLFEYKKRINDFRNPKIKKHLLWRQIALNFKTHGYNLSPELIDKKFRNMKQTYKKIKKNNSRKTTGTGRLSWPYTDTMDEIFKNDESVIFTNNVIDSLQSSSEIALNLSSDREIESDNNDIDMLNDTSNDSSLLHDREQPSNNEIRSVNNGDKNKKHRQLYGQRNHQLRLENEKNTILKQLSKTAENNNNILSTNAAIWREGIDSLVAVMKEKNMVEKEKNEIMKERNIILRDISNKLN